jgi:hypothetical protein
LKNTTGQERSIRRARLPRTGGLVLSLAAVFLSAADAALPSNHMIAGPGGPAGVHAANLTTRFQHPLDAMKPYCYWYWLGGQITKEGIANDLENMRDVGISLAMIGNVGVNPKGPELLPKGQTVRMFTSQWYALTRHALREAHRVGVDLYMFQGPAWSQSGGPWIKPEKTDWVSRLPPRAIVNQNSQKLFHC